MIPFAGRVILLDIEGTTSPIQFIYEVMFPYVVRELDNYLRAHWGREPLAGTCEQIARDAGYESLSDWCGSEPPERQRQVVREEVLRLMKGDVKATGLKTLQGLIWHDGFTSGELQGEVFDDVPPALLQWNANGIDVRIYSSGSIAAQKLFFAHTHYGNLLKQFRGHYDTTSGSKREAQSYTTIAADIGCEPNEILFLSDVVPELDAARAAGFRTGLVRRPGNPDPAEHAHEEIGSFVQVQLID